MSARFILIVFFSLLFTGAAVAQSCQALRSQLAAAERGGGGGNARLEQQARAYGCYANTRFGRHRACAGILARINRGGASRGQVRRLRRQVQRACGRQQRRQQERVVRRGSREAPAQQRTRNLSNTSRILAVTPTRRERREGRGNVFSSIFGNLAPRDEVQVVDPSDPRFNGRVERVNLDVDRKVRTERRTGPGRTQVLATGRGGRRSLRVGSSRTVCVRLCDGFYFPINNRSHSDNFYDELAMCVGRCPGADVSLYVHNNQSAVEGMRSTMTGEPYVRLPTAFTYRRKTVPDCSCRTGTTIVADALNAEAALKAAGLDEESVRARREAEARREEQVASARDWTRLKAVYDGTGRPLKLFPKLGRGRGASADDGAASAEGTQSADLASGPDVTAATVGGATAAVALDPIAPLPGTLPKGPPRPMANAGGKAEAAAGVRRVGSSDYIDAIAASVTAEAERDARPDATVRSTAITVVPLAGETAPGPTARDAAPPSSGQTALSLEDRPVRNQPLFAASNPR